MKSLLDSTVLPGPPTQSSIVELLRTQIVSGSLAPGQKLPTRDELTQSFGTTRDTVQRAFDVLIAHGFISTQGRRGTFVATHPPHLARYALVFSSTVAAGSRFDVALASQAEVLQAEGDFKLPIFRAVAQDTATSGYRQLFEEAATHRLSGLIFTYNPAIVTEYPHLEGTGLPMVAIMSNSSTPQVPYVTMDSKSFFRKAIAHLVSRGKKRVAVLDHFGAVRNFTRDKVEKEFALAGLKMWPYWWQSVHLHGAASARSVVQLLTHPHQVEAPEALLILDDNLESYALDGLRDVSLLPGKDIEVVSHCNLPRPSTPCDSVVRLGYDSAQVLRQCIQTLEAVRLGGPFERQTLVEAQFSA